LVDVKITASDKVARLLRCSVETCVCSTFSIAVAVPRTQEGISFVIQHNWRRQMLVRDRRRPDELRRFLRQLRRSENSSSSWQRFFHQHDDPWHRMRLLYRVRRLGATAGHVWKGRSGSCWALPLHRV